MSEIDIRKYAQLMAEYGLTGLEFRTAGDTVRMERSGVPAPAYLREPGMRSWNPGKQVPYPWSAG